MRAKVAAQPPNEVLDIFEREQSTLVTFGQPDGILPVGSTLPDVELIVWVPKMSSDLLARDDAYRDLSFPTAVRRLTI